MDSSSSSSSSPSAAFPFQQQQSQEAVPNPAEVSASSSTTTSSGSIGPFFAVIFVLTFLAIVSCFIGRICKGRSVSPLQSVKRPGFLGWLRQNGWLSTATDAKVSANKGMAGQTGTNDGEAAVAHQDAV